MMGRILVWSMVVSMVLGVAGLAGAESTLDVVTKRGWVNAGLRNDVPPFNYVDKDGNLQGFDIEFARAIVKKLGVEMKYKLVTSSTRIPMLTSGQIDFALVATTPTRKRGALVDYSIVYAWLEHQALVRKDSPITSIKELAAPRVAASVQGSGNNVIFLRAQPRAKIVYFQEWPQTALALKAGKVDAVIGLALMNQAFMNAEPGVFRMLPEVYFRDPLAILVRKDDSRWRDAINNAISELWEEGTYAEIFERMLGMKLPFTLEIMPKE
jgi:polar amino acid transport system substrate-binding protein